MTPRIRVQNLDHPEMEAVIVYVTSAPHVGEDLCIYGVIYRVMRVTLVCWPRHGVAPDYEAVVEVRDTPLPGEDQPPS